MGREGRLGEEGRCTSEHHTYMLSHTPPRPSPQQRVNVGSQSGLLTPSYARSEGREYKGMNWKGYEEDRLASSLDISYH